MSQIKVLGMIYGYIILLDIGCGAGILCEGLGRLGMTQITGIDPTDKCVELANEHLKQDSDLS